MPPAILRLPKKEFLSRGFMAVRTPYFSLKIKKNTLKKIRIGVIIGKAVHKTAVERNFLKRQAKEVFGKNIPVGNDLLVIFSPAASKLTKKQLKEVLIKSAARI
jgi:ribonuclease P protein component